MRWCAAFIALAVLAGCGAKSSRTVSATISMPASSASSSSSAPRELVAAFAVNLSSALRGAEHLVASKSSAADFVTASINAMEASEDTKAFQGVAGTVAVEGDGFKVCFPSDGSPFCQRYHSFAFNSAGAITTFSIDDASIDGTTKIAAGKTVDVAGAAFTPLSILRRFDRALVVTARVRTTTQALTLNAKQAVYRDSSGEPTPADDAIAAIQVLPNSTATFLMLFPPSEFDGKVTITPCFGTCATKHPVVLSFA